MAALSRMPSQALCTRWGGTGWLGLAGEDSWQPGIGWAARGESRIGRLRGHGPSLPPPTLTGVDGVGGAVQGGGRWAEPGPIHHPEELGAIQQRVGEGLGRMRVVSRGVAQDGLHQQELIGLLLHETWVGGSTLHRAPAQIHPRLFAEQGSIGLPEAVPLGNRPPRG